MNQRTTTQGLMEVAVLKAGQAFGELALISNKARAATIKTLTETHLLVLNRKDFERVLRRQEEASISKLVDFFKSIPHFKNWTKNSLSKLTYFFHRETYSRNQVVYSEGDTCSQIYIVFQGDFQILKGKPQYQNLISEKSINSYLGPQGQNRKDNHQRNQSFQLPNQGVQYEQQILIVGQGNFLGEEDAVRMVDYTTTVKCYSEKGVLLVMKVQDFYQKIKGSTDTWQLIKNVAKSKENTTNNSLIRQYYLDKDNKEQAKEIVRQKINEVEIDDMDFFKTMFWGEPIPSRKIDKIIQLNSQMRESSKIVRVYKEEKQKLNYYNSFLQREKVKIVGLGDSGLISKDKENDINKQNKAVFLNKNEQQTQQAKQFEQYEAEPAFKNYYVSRNINNTGQNAEIIQEITLNKDNQKPRRSNASQSHFNEVSTNYESIFNHQRSTSNFRMTLNLINQMNAKRLSNRPGSSKLNRINRKSIDESSTVSQRLQQSIQVSQSNSHKRRKSTLTEANENLLSVQKQAVFMPQAQVFNFDTLKRHASIKKARAMSSYCQTRNNKTLNSLS